MLFRSNFESVVSADESHRESDEIMSVLNDMILSIRDNEFHVGVFFRKNYRPTVVEFSNYLDIEIAINNKSFDPNSSPMYKYRPFQLEDVKEDIFQIVEFMSGEGWSIKSVVIADNSVPLATHGINYDVYIENGEIIGKDKNSEESWVINEIIGEIRIKFTKSKL